MDQLKDILKQAIKYRFWIAVGISAILPIIAYAAGSGAIQQKAAEETSKIKAADTDVRQYASGVVPNAQYKPIVETKKDELVKDVTASWKKLYERQAPLLTWPKTVEERFRTWERKWPENTDPGAVQLAIIEYVTAYPKFVTEIYQTFHPFDLDPASTETGIVSAPPQDLLLKPFPFTIENPPALGKVWAAQERLWTQRTLLEVIAQVNHNSRDWDTATIKQINLLEVGNALAQDQKSVAKAETLVEAPAIADPAIPAAPAEGAPGPAPGMPKPMGQQSNELVYYINNPSTQFKILPFQISVLIEQNRIQDLLVALENSPMAVQVMEFEMSKPSVRVVKPLKGQNTNFYDYSGQMFQQGIVPMSRSSGPYITPMPRTGGPVGKTGINRRDVDRKAAREHLQKQAENVTTHTLHDPYFNIVEVTIYGQARFYNPPPAEPAPAPSTAEPAPTADGATPPVTEAPKPEGEAPKEEAPMPNGEAPKAEAPKEEPAPAPMPNGEAPKAEAPKEEPAPAAQPAPAPAGTPGGEAPKAESGAPAPK
jgi:hypothetical protein